MAAPYYSLQWRDQPDRSVAADFLEELADRGLSPLLDTQGAWWFPDVPAHLPARYGVRLRTGQPLGTLHAADNFRPPGILRGSGERLTLDPGETDTYLAASFLLDRVEGVALSPEGIMLLDSPYAGGSTARARNFAEQFGLIVTLNDDRRLAPKWSLRRVRLAILNTHEKAEAMLNRYRVPYTSVASEPPRPACDTLIVGHPGQAPNFRHAGGLLIAISNADSAIVDGAYELMPATARRLLQTIYLGSAHAL